MAVVQLPDGTTVDLNNPAAPSASEVADWANQRQQLSQGFSAAQAQAAQQSGAAQAQYGSDSAALTNKYAQLRERLPGTYAKRGLLNSGIYQQGLGQYATNRATDFNKLATTYLNQVGAINSNAAIAYGNTLAGTASVNRAEAARRADLAAALRNIS